MGCGLEIWIKKSRHKGALYAKATKRRSCTNLRRIAEARADCLHEADAERMHVESSCDSQSTHTGNQHLSLDSACFLKHSETEKLAKFRLQFLLAGMTLYLPDVLNLGL